MNAMLSKLRGTLGTAMTWAVAWGLGGLAAFGVLFAVTPGLSGFVSMAPLLGTLCAVSGFTAGVAFSVVLATAYRRSRLDALPLRAIGAWGAAAGLLVPGWALLGSVTAGILIEWDLVAALFVSMAGFGATTATATVALAQSEARALDEGHGLPLPPG